MSMQRTTYIFYRAETLQAAKKKKSSLSFLEKNPFKFDSSSSEDEAEGGDEKAERKAKFEWETVDAS